MGTFEGPPGAPYNSWDAWAPQKGLAVRGSSVGPVARCVAAFAHWEGGRIFFLGGGLLCCAPPCPLITFCYRSLATSLVAQHICAAT